MFSIPFTLALVVLFLVGCFCITTAFLGIKQIFGMASLCSLLWECSVLSLMYSCCLQIFLQENTVTDG